MNSDDIVRMAREAGGMDLVKNNERFTTTVWFGTDRNEFLERFAHEAYAAGAAAEREKYNDLLMAVGEKFHDESRHETALRYIREAESKSDCAAAIRARGDK